MVEQLKATLAIDTGDIIGEAPTWDAAKRRLLWSDNKIGIVHEAKPDSTGTWHATRHWNLARRIGAAIPRAAGGFIVASGTEFLLMSEEGELTPFARLEADPGHFHLNDAKCDRQGRLWAGPLDSDINTPGRMIRPGRGALYRVDPDGTVSTILHGVTVSNGLDWSPDGTTFYFIDSYRRQIDAFDFDAAQGAIANRRALVSFAPGDGAPDGMTVDGEGGVWVAVAGAGEVRRYSPRGDLLTRVAIPVPTPTSCAFGGEDGATLFVTSARVILPATAFTQLTHGFSVEMDNAATGAGAGALFVCRPGVTGPPATPFAG